MDTNQLNWTPEAQIRTVFEDDNWELVTGRSTYLHGLKVSIRHACSVRDNDVRAVFVFDVDSRHCWRCTELIPEGIIGLFRLYNWDQT